MRRTRIDSKRLFQEDGLTLTSAWKNPTGNKVKRRESVFAADVKLDWTEIARSGHYPGKIPLSRGLFESMLDRFPGQSKSDGVPCCIGHPWDDEPAWGWVTGLKITVNGEKGYDRGASLWMTADLSSELAEMIRDGKFKNRSVSIGQSPEGNFELRHVAWLGAAAPAVKGMKKPPDLSDPEIPKEENSGYYIFAADGEVFNQTKGNAMKDAKKGTEAGPPPVDPQSDGKDRDYVSKAEFDRLQADYAEEKKRAEELREKAVLAELRSFCDRLVGEGKLTPAEAKSMPAILAALEDCEQSIGEGEVKLSARGALKAQLEARKKIVEFGELTSSGSESQSDSAAQAKFGSELSDRSDLDARVREYAGKHNTSYATALQAIMKGAKR